MNKEEIFERNIEPLMEKVAKLCENAGIEFFTTFKLDLYQSALYKTPNMVLDATDILNQIQLWEVKNNKKLI